MRSRPAPRRDGALYDDCLALLRTTGIGRVALSIDALPVVMPVNFAMFGDDIVFRPMLDEKLSRSAGDVVLAFQVDNFDLASHTGWSVLIQGIASEIVEAELIERCRDSPDLPAAHRAGTLVGSSSWRPAPLRVAGWLRSPSEPRAVCSATLRGSPGS